MLSLVCMRNPLPSAADADLEALSSVARTLEPVQPCERKAVMRDEAAFLLDGLLVRVARGRGRLDLAIGAGLATLTVGDRLLRLGFSGLGDYSRERLGLAGSTAEKLARLARNLSERPLLRAAVQSGAVSCRKAETIVALARGDAEAAWVEKARVETVRALAAEVRAELGEGAEAEEESWERVGLVVAPAAREKLGEALALAGKVLGATAPTWQRIEAICQEYLGAHPPPIADDEQVASRLLGHARSGQDLEELKAWLEKEHQRWEFLTQFDPAPLEEPLLASAEQAGGETASGGSGGAAGGAAGGRSGGDGLAAEAVAGALATGGALASAPSVDLARLDADLRRLRELRSRWDDLLGHLALIFRQLGLWRDMRFVSIEHYFTERLGMSDRTVGQRIALERRLYDLPPLRDAMRSGRVTYEKARIVAAHATERTLEAWLQRAERLTCIALAREAEAEEEQQTCAWGEVSWRLPARVVSLLESALRAAREAAGRFLTPSEGLQLIAEHFIETNRDQLAERNTVQKRVLARDRDRCQVPGCSRAALQAHHVKFRSHLGGDAEENLTGICAAHHLHGIHAGYLRVTGVAPHRLRWSFRHGGGPLSLTGRAPASGGALGTR